MHAQILEYSATPARRRTLMVVGLLFAVFAAAIAVLLHVRSTTTDWPIEPPFEFGNLLMVFSMAMAAICGSVTIVVGAHSLDRNKPEEAVRWLAIAISSWLVFLFLECVEWANLVYIKELGPATPFGGTFLLLTGLHWVAVMACTVWFTIAIADVRKRDILAAALYSHFLALWWIVLVVVLYGPNINPLADF